MCPGVFQPWGGSRMRDSSNHPRTRATPSSWSRTFPTWATWATHTWLPRLRERYYINFIERFGVVKTHTLKCRKGNEWCKKTKQIIAVDCLFIISSPVFFDQTLFRSCAWGVESIGPAFQWQGLVMRGSKRYYASTKQMQISSVSF